MAPITKSSLVSGSSDGQWGMPPLSAYTPFESLLFFQSLAALEARPTSFSAISDTLRNNHFIRDNVAFDANRLSPAALEELYTTLVEEGFDGNHAIADQNGHLKEAGIVNPKKRKITNTKAEAGNVDNALSYTTIVPGLISQLYARYKERVTKEIRNEEKRFKEIREDMQKLQKEEVELAPKIAETTSQPQPATSATDAMDIDASKQNDQVQAPLVRTAQSLPGKTEEARQPATISTQQLPIPDTRTPMPSVNQPQPGQSPLIPVTSQQEPPPQSGEPVVSTETAAAQPGKTQPLTQPPAGGNIGPKIPSTAAGKPSVLPPSQSATQTSSPVTGKVQVKVPSAPQQSRPPTQPSTRAGASNRDRPALPPGSTIVFPAQQGVSLPATSPGVAPRPPAQPMVAGSPLVPPFPAGQQPFQQWSPHHTPQTPYSNVSPFTNPAYGNQPILERPVVPQHAPTPGRPFTGPFPGPAPMTPGTFPSATQSPMVDVSGQQTPFFARTPSFSTTISKRPSRQSVGTAGSLTPWKRSPRLSISIPQTPGSPNRPKPEDVSPISDRAPSLEPVEASTKKDDSRNKRPAAEGEHPKRGRKKSMPPLDLDKSGTRADKSTLLTRAKRAESTASTRSRGRSVVSRDESATGSVAGHRTIKHEAPTTPAGIIEDTEVELRAGTRRRGATTTGPSEEGPAKARSKRKRDASEVLEPDTDHATPNRHESSLVFCTRNFPRTGQPIMNDVAAHKHASIFAKPLTEREAPGYKDLIYRPQDLKSIKSAIHQGSKAVSAATEAASTPADGESPNPAAGTPSKNAVLTLQKSADLVPPKGIVNSSQLEKELIRMFANAVMFNPAPERERGFGPAFPMGKADESRAGSQPWEVDEGGIVRDTREMCDDVEQAVTRWRAAERTADELGNKSLLSLRRGSIGDINTDGTDDMKA